MKIKNIVSILILLVVVSCAKEDDIVPRKSEGTSKFEFPQGNNTWDNQLVEIYEKYGVKCIYKGITKVDLNKLWTGTPPNGDYGVNGYELPNDEMKQYYTDFFANHVFKYFDPKLLVGLPPYIYFIYDYYERGDNSYYFNKPEKYPNAKEYRDFQMRYNFKGIDFWAFNFECTERVNNYGNLSPSITRPATKREFGEIKEPIVRTLIDKMYKKGIIKEPAFFLPEQATDIDYKTPVKTADGDMEDPNYYRTRGFVEQTNGMLTEYYLSKPRNTGSGSSQVVLMSPSVLFQDYIYIGVRYTKEEMETVYAKYPKVLKYYNLTREYLKTTYNIDLNDVAVCPFEN